MKIEYASFCIRNADVSDAKIICKWWNDDNLAKTIGFSNNFNIKEEEIIMQLTHDRNHLILGYQSQPIGEVIFREVGYKTIKLMIRICVSSLRDRGYGKIFISMILQVLFYELDHEKIIIDTDLENIRAQHVFSTLGFNKIRVNMDCYKDHHGDMHSLVEYELYRDEFNSYINSEDLVFHPQVDQ